MSSVEPSRLRLGIYLAFGLATFALAPILVRFAGDVHPVSLAVIRTVSAVIIILPFWLKSRIQQKFEPWGTRETVLAFLAGTFLALHFIFWIASLSYTSVASASVLVTIHPVILIVTESLLRTNRYGAITWGGVILAFSGSALLGIFDTDAAVTYSNPMLGNGMAFLAAVLFVGYILLSRSLRSHASWLDFVFRVYAGTAITCVIIFFVMGLSLKIAPIAIVCGLLLGIGPQLIGHGSINYSVKYISPTLLSTLILTEPVFAIILAAFLFNEIPTLAESSAMFVIIVGVGISWIGGIKFGSK